ncbi:uncharacterized protein YALI1_E37494g [Yarrowia lipolytica]|uniref:Uncharacterized protein n=1 Tax=Yarrowia lipolytica TaxID=4952 RepID=A0A1D8NKV5_YARLL|nr:hypothetical protein YALI1_E37494g [Yarrowia lipolytica]
MYKYPHQSYITLLIMAVTPLVSLLGTDCLRSRTQINISYRLYAQLRTSRTLQILVAHVSARLLGILHHLSQGHGPAAASALSQHELHQQLLGGAALALICQDQSMGRDITTLLVQTGQKLSQLDAVVVKLALGQPVVLLEHLFHLCHQISLGHVGLDGVLLRLSRHSLGLSAGLSAPGDSDGRRRWQRSRAAEVGD